VNVNIFLIEHAISWITERRESSQIALTSLKTDSSKPIDGCVVEVIRDMSPEGGEKMIGSVEISRCTDAGQLLQAYAVEPREGQDLSKINNERDVGDPEIVWTIGCKWTFLPGVQVELGSNEHWEDHLSPAHHGKGIMSAAASSLLHDIGIPKMGVRRMLGTVHKGNDASMRIFEKLGFDLIEKAAVVEGVRRPFFYKWELENKA
jgi:RimJ/RimL family protein N-acetyltransferase